MTSALIVNEEEVRRLIEQMRVTVPESMRQSQRIMYERERIIAQAHEEAARIIQMAQEQSGAITGGDAEVQARAEAQAQALIAAATRRSEAMIREADAYALSVLRNLGDHLEQALYEVQNGILELEEPEAEGEEEEAAEMAQA